MTETDTKLPLTSEVPLESRLSALEALIPEAFSEGRVNFDKLKSALGEAVETSQERYGLTWAGKSEAIRAVQIPNKGTLEPMPEQSVNFNGSQNAIIEGDNLEVLKLLQKSYYGKVKMIYIDPPYNTGNEFIYPDNFKEGLEDYLLYSGQRTDDGTRLSTNEDQAGRKHSKWLNMMYPRLFLARNLLREDGVIFISIDDNEVKNLRALMDEVFGEENFIATAAWQKKQSPQNDATYLSDMHDYVLIYARRARTNKADNEGWISNKLKRNEQHDARYTNSDNDPRGAWASADATVNKTSEERPNLYYSVVNPNTGAEVYPSKQRVWSLEKKRMDALIEEDAVWWGAGGDNFPRLKRYLSEMVDGVVPSTWWKREEYGDNQEASREIRKLFPEAFGIFDFPKPSRLIKGMLALATSPQNDDIALDFFAGSGTAAQAVMELNEEDGGNRRFILVQLPEPTDRPDYPTITDITRERVRRVIAKLDKADEGKLELTDRPDRGFKAFRLTASNFKVWDADNAPQDAAALERQLDLFTENVTGDKEQSVLYELVLKSGFPLAAKLEPLALGQNVYAVEDKALYICLANPITQDTLTAVAEAKPERFICLDVAFNGKDELKTNTVLQMRNAGIAFHTA